MLCDRLGIPLAYKDIVFQGTQAEVGLGRPARARRLLQHVRRPGPPGSDAEGGALPDGLTVETDPETGDVHLVRGPHFRGIQFHAESILTEHGSDLVHRLASDLLAESTPS